MAMLRKIETWQDVLCYLLGVPVYLVTVWLLKRYFSHIWAKWPDFEDVAPFLLALIPTTLVVMGCLALPDP